MKNKLIKINQKRQEIVDMLEAIDNRKDFNEAIYVLGISTAIKRYMNLPTMKGIDIFITDFENSDKPYFKDEIRLMLVKLKELMALNKEREDALKEIINEEMTSNE